MTGMNSSRSPLNEPPELEKWSNKKLSDISDGHRLFPVLLLISLLLSVIAGGYLVFDKLRQNETRKIEQNLAAVAHLKADQINGWLSQNKINAEILSKDSYIAKRTEYWLGQGALEGPISQELRARLETVRQTYGYSELALLDTNGKLLLATDEKAQEEPGLQLLFRDAIAQRKPIVGDMRWDVDQDGVRVINLPIAAPLIASHEEGPAIGILLIKADPNNFLYPLIQSWPTPSNTAETLLVKRDGDDVLFLNELRHQKNTALTLRTPAGHPTRAVSQALRGSTGLISGTDYRNEKVLGYSLKIPSTDWFMVAKIDSKEVYEPIRRLALITSLVTLFTLSIVTVSLFFWWRQRVASYRAHQLRSELKQQLLVKQFDYLSKYANDIILLIDPKGKIVEANDRAEVAYGLKRSELIDQNIRILRTSEEQGKLEAQWQHIKASGSLLYESHHVKSDGSQFPVEINARLIETEQGWFVQTIIRDITERKLAQAREQRMTNIHRALSATNEAIIHTDSEASLLPLVCRIAVEYGGMTITWIGVPNEERRFIPVASYGKGAERIKEVKTYAMPDMPEGRGPAGVAFRSGQPIVSSDFSKEGLIGPWQKLAEKYDIRAVAAFPIKRGGKPYGIWLVYSDHADAFDAEIVRLLNEMTDNISFALNNFDRETARQQAENKTWVEANFDTLTGLPNRRLFQDRLKHEIRNARRANAPLGLMFLDLDGFKDVNDTLGHEMGDLLLKEAASRLNGCVREADTVARLGGDEFTVILAELHDPGNIDRIARHILSALSEPFQLDGETAYVSASIGITLFPNDGLEVEDLIRNADQAMYSAKQEGKNRYHYYTESMQEAAQARMRLVNDLRFALDGNQFEVVYQPIVELSMGTVHKAEALIRWQHPTQGLINPIDFISTAEDTGMIASFGNWIFHEAARQAAVWRERYHSTFQISVNISPVQFKKEGIDPSIWLGHLKNLDLPGEGIVVEITEGLLLDASSKVTDQLLMLRDAGIEVSLDDFGTGYSSLSYLKKFDIDYIKIDQTFVRNLAPDSDDMALCEAIIVMAHKLGIKVIAEGIETKEQCSLLMNAGCDYGQGFLFSRPVPKKEFEMLMNRALRPNA